jgi:hypothetical protein
MYMTMLLSGQGIRLVAMTGDGIRPGTTVVSDGMITGMIHGIMAVGVGMIRSTTVGMAAGIAVGTILGTITLGMLILGTMVAIICQVGVVPTTMHLQSVVVLSIVTA